MKNYLKLMLPLVFLMFSLNTFGQKNDPMTKGKIEKEIKVIEENQLRYNVVKFYDIIAKIDSQKVSIELEGWVDPITGELKSIKVKFSEEDESSQEIYYFKNNRLIYAKNIEYRNDVESYYAEIFAVNHDEIIIYINNQRSKPSDDIIDATKAMIIRDIKIYVSILYGPKK